MIATKIWAEMTRKVGVSTSSAPLRKSSVGGNSQLGASSIGSQVGSGSPPDPDEKVMSDSISSLLVVLTFVALSRGQAAETWEENFRLLFPSDTRPLSLRPLSDPRHPPALHYIPIKHPPLPLPQHKCTGSAPN